MTINIGFDWWIVPTLITVFSWLFAHIECKKYGMPTGGLGDAFIGMFVLATYGVFFATPSLIAWLVWALLR